MDTSQAKYLFLGLLSNAILPTVIGSVQCSYYSYSVNGKRQIKYRICPTSCCGSRSERRCCDQVTGLPALTIVWISIAIFVAVGTFLLIMCCRRRRAGPSRITWSQRQEFGGIQTGNMNPGYAGPTVPNSQTQTGFQQMDVGSLSPPDYETVLKTPSNAPPEYSTLYKT